MAGRIVLDGFNPALDSDGNIDDGCTITFYENGTTTLQTIYSASDLLTPLQNPLPTTDAAGRFPDVWTADGTEYSLKVEYTNGDIRTRDNVRATLSNGYDLPVFIQGQPADGETYPIFLVTRNLRLPANLAGSQFAIKGTAPAATATFTLKKNGSDIGSISFATDKTPTVSFSSSVSLSAADALSMDAPNPADTDASDFAFTFVSEVLS